MAAPVRGAFIVLEGLDRSGKTTQAKLLEEKLSQGGRRVKLMRFPGKGGVCTVTTPIVTIANTLSPDRSTPIGQMIDSYLKSQTPIEDHAIHLLFSANRWEAACVSPKPYSTGPTTYQLAPH